MPHTIPNRETLSVRVESSRRRLAEAVRAIHGMMSGSPAGDAPPLRDALTELCRDLQDLGRDIESIRDHLDHGTIPRLHGYHVPFSAGTNGATARELPFTD